MNGSYNKIYKIKNELINQINKNMLKSIHNIFLYIIRFDKYSNILSKLFMF